MQAISFVAPLNGLLQETIVIRGWEMQQYCLLYIWWRGRNGGKMADTLEETRRSMRFIIQVVRRRMSAILPAFQVARGGPSAVSGGSTV